MKKYIHFGAKNFDPNKVREIKNRKMFTKPIGGFWASPTDAKYGWEEWSENNYYEECDENNSITFTLTDNAKVLTIKSVDDLKNLPINVPLGFNFTGTVYLDFEALAREYDAIEVYISEDSRLYEALYGWNCDNILIMNKDIIKECK